MSSTEPGGAVGQALVDFTINGAFPEEDVSSLKLSAQELSPAVEALAEAKSKLEVCPHDILTSSKLASNWVPSPIFTQ